MAENKLLLTEMDRSKQMMNFTTKTKKSIKPKEEFKEERIIKEDRIISLKEFLGR